MIVEGRRDPRKGLYLGPEGVPCWYVTFEKKKSLELYE